MVGEQHCFQFAVGDDRGFVDHHPDGFKATLGTKEHIAADALGAILAVRPTTTPAVITVAMELAMRSSDAASR